MIGWSHLGQVPLSGCTGYEQWVLNVISILDLLEILVFLGEREVGSQEQAAFPMFHIVGDPSSRVSVVISYR